MPTGRTPFVAPTPQAMVAAHITQRPEPVSQHRSAISPALNALVMRCLESDDRLRATEYYGRFVELWNDADPELQPGVRVRERLVRLSQEPAR
ncbi:MAG: hypothetical protein ACREMX_07040 [Gemmatimonadales bacterium]